MTWSGATAPQRRGLFLAPLVITADEIQVLAGMQRAGPNDSGELILASAMRGYQSKPSLRKEKAPNPWHLLMASRHPQVDEILPSHSCEFEPISGATGLQKLLQGRRFCLRNENFCR